MTDISYQRSNGQLEQLIESLMHMAGARQNRELIRDMILTALKAGQDDLDRGDLKILAGAMKELRYSFQLFGEYTDRRKVTIFGSARTQPGDPAYEQARECAQQCVEAGFMVITGAGGGIMQAGNEGAGPGNSFGVNIDLPFEQQANEFIVGDPKLINFKYFFTRKINFLKHANAVILFPGGFGTMDEAFESLTLAQTGKTNLVPVIFIAPPGNPHWEQMEDYMRDCLYARGLVSPQDEHLYLITDSVDAAVGEISRFYHRFHSYRYVRDELVIRMHSEIPTAILDELNQDYSDILVDGSIRACSALDVEITQNDVPELPRLRMHFNRTGLGRLRQLIDRINQC